MQAIDQAIPLLPSRSIEATCAFYRRLGFEGGPHAFDDGYAILCRGALELHFFRHATLEPGASDAGCYLRVLDVEAIHRDCVASDLPTQGIPRMTALEDKPWGLREFAVVDPDGTLLRIGQVIRS